MSEGLTTGLRTKNLIGEEESWSEKTGCFAKNQPPKFRRGETKSQGVFRSGGVRRYRNHQNTWEKRGGRKQKSKWLKKESAFSMGQRTSKEANHWKRSQSRAGAQRKREKKVRQRILSKKEYWNFPDLPKGRDAREVKEDVGKTEIDKYWTTRRLGSTWDESGGQRTLGRINGGANQHRMKKKWGKGQAFKSDGNFRQWKKS